MRSILKKASLGLLGIVLATNVSAEDVKGTDVMSALGKIAPFIPIPGADKAARAAQLGLQGAGAVADNMNARENAKRSASQQNVTIQTQSTQYAQPQPPQRIKVLAPVDELFLSYPWTDLNNDGYCGREEFPVIKNNFEYNEPITLYFYPVNFKGTIPSTLYHSSGEKLGTRDLDSEGSVYFLLLNRLWGYSGQGLEEFLIKYSLNGQAKELHFSLDFTKKPEKLSLDFFTGAEDVDGNGKITRPELKGLNIPLYDISKEKVICYCGTNKKGVFTFQLFRGEEWIAETKQDFQGDNPKMLYGTSLKSPSGEHPDFMDRLREDYISRGCNTTTYTIKAVSPTGKEETRTLKVTGKLEQKLEVPTQAN